MRSLLMAVFTFLQVLPWITLYVYVAYCLYSIAQRLHIATAWRAWVPIVNLTVIVDAAGASRKNMLLLFGVPVLSQFIAMVGGGAWKYVAYAAYGVALAVLWRLWMGIGRALQKPAWMGAVAGIPILGLPFQGHFAGLNIGATSGAVVAIAALFAGIPFEARAHDLQELQMRADDPESNWRRWAAFAAGSFSGSSTAMDVDIRLLDDKDESVRAAAADGLGRFGQAAGPATPALLRSLEMGNSRAWSALLDIGAPAVPAMCTVLGNTHYKQRKEVAYQLGQMHRQGRMGEAANAATRCLTELISAASDTEVRNTQGRELPARGLLISGGDFDADIRDAALEALREINPSSAGPALAGALSSDSADVRYYAANRMSRMQTPPEEALPGLLRLARESDSRLVSAACWNLTKFGSRASDASPALVEFLQKMNVDKEAGTAFSIIQTLGTIGPGAQQAAPLLQKIRSTSKTDFLRRGAGEALARINTAQ